MSTSTFSTKATLIGLALTLAVALNAEGASWRPKNGVSGVTAYTIGGSVSGLGSGKSFVLTNNGSYAMTISANGAFTLPGNFAKGTTYNVKVGINPGGQTCVIAKGTGTVNSSNITSISITCTNNTYTVGGSVSGLASGQSLVLNNNGSAVMNVASNGNFTLPGAYVSGYSYNVTLATQPSLQTCLVTNGNSTVISSNITNITVVCTTTSYTIGGSVSGLGSGKSLILNNNGSTAMTVTANGSFTLPGSFGTGFAYNISVGAQPSGQTCSISNGAGSVATTNVSNVSVACVNNNVAPTISGTPATTVIVGNLYTFSPTATDSNGDTLAFSIANKPSWVNFDSTTGQLSGTPTATGDFSNIVISVSDGTATTSLPAFTITVTSNTSSTGNAVLNWTIPTQNTDGSSLTDLTGYVIYYGTSANPDALTNSITISSGSTTTATIEGLTAGTTYYFSIASVSATGGEGTKSNPASKTI